MVRFSDSFRHELEDLMRWRRDVRHFRPDPVDPEVLDRCLQSFTLAPSVGLSQPWRLRRIQSDPARAAARDNFQSANAEALKGYGGDKAATYARLKLSGMDKSPEQLAIFCDEVTPQGSGLGAQTMPEMRRYSVVCAIMQFWLVARAAGLGVGWISILDAPALCRSWGIPEDWELVAYLCIGWPEEETIDPELERVGWETRRELPHIETL